MIAAAAFLAAVLVQNPTEIITPYDDSKVTRVKVRVAVRAGGRSLYRGTMLLRPFMQARYRQTLFQAPPLDCPLDRYPVGWNDTGIEVNLTAVPNPAEIAAKVVWIRRPDGGCGTAVTETMTGRVPICTDQTLSLTWTQGVNLQLQVARVEIGTERRRTRCAGALSK